MHVPATLGLTAGAVCLATLGFITLGLIVPPRASTASPASASSTGQSGDCQAVELGAVAWGRDLDVASGLSRQDGRPVFLLFQEVPGCATCRNFGSGPLSHRLLVEAIETEFHPVLVYNNRDGDDGLVRQAFGEPAWNNPVVRFLDAKQADVLPRRDRVWSTAGIAQRMIDALQAAGRDIPPYLTLVAAESGVAAPEQATFAMHCFWEGAAAIGDIDGVVDVRAGFLDGSEVVEATFDAAAIAVEELAAEVQRRGQARKIYVANTKLHQRLEDVVANVVLTKEEMRKAGDGDQLYYLRHSSYRVLDLQGLQAVRVNAELGRRGDPEAWLSPRQRERLHNDG